MNPKNLAEDAQRDAITQAMLSFNPQGTPEQLTEKMSFYDTNPAGSQPVPYEPPPPTDGRYPYHPGAIPPLQPWVYPPGGGPSALDDIMREFYGGGGAPSSYIPQNYATQPSPPAGGGQTLAHDLPPQLTPRPSGSTASWTPSPAGFGDTGLGGSPPGVTNYGGYGVPSAAFTPSQPGLNSYYDPTIGGARRQ